MKNIIDTVEEKVEELLHPEESVDVPEVTVADKPAVIETVEPEAESIEETLAEEVKEPVCGECEGEGLKGKDRVGNEVVCIACGGTGKA